MSERKKETARAVAVEVLNRCDLQKDYAGPILDELLNRTDQRQRATDLVYGSLRNLIAIDKVIGTFSGRRCERIPNKLLNIIRVGVYEIIYSPATEVYAIVNEAVESAKTLAGKKQVGFVNAVLREIIRHITNRQISLSQAQEKKTVIQNSEAGCEFDTAFLPDSETNPAVYMSIVFSLPQWLVEDWLAEFGFEQARQICLASNRRPGIYLRPNALKITAQELADKLHNQDVDCEIIEAMLKLRSPKAVSELPGFEEGLFVVQDITASQPVRLLNPKPDWTMLDLCAAPGTKTTQLAEATGDSATIIATDIDSRRLNLVSENAVRLGLRSIKVVTYDKFPVITTEIGLFDAILLDVPCSNTGVLAKRVEARYRLNQKAIGNLAKTQSELLKKAAGLVKPQGKICYSTCSIQKAENSELIENFLREHPDFVLENEQLVLPSVSGSDCDGGYTAILKNTKKP